MYAEIILSAFRRIARYNQASIADLQEATGLRLYILQSEIQELRYAGILSGSGVETGDERIRAAAIREGQDLIGYVSLRN